MSETAHQEAARLSLSSLRRHRKSGYLCGVGATGDVGAHMVLSSYSFLAPSGPSSSSVAASLSSSTTADTWASSSRGRDVEAVAPSPQRRSSGPHAGRGNVGGVVRASLSRHSLSRQPLPAITWAPVAPFWHVGSKAVVGMFASALTAVCGPCPDSSLPPGGGATASSAPHGGRVACLQLDADSSTFVKVGWASPAALDALRHMLRSAHRGHKGLGASAGEWEAASEGASAVDTEEQGGCDGGSSEEEGNPAGVDHGGSMSSPHTRAGARVGARVAQWCAENVTWECTTMSTDRLRGPHRQLYRYCGHMVDEVLSRTPLVTLRTPGAVGVLMSNQPTPDFVYTTDDDAKSAHMSFRRQRCILVDRAGGPAPGVPATLTVPLDDAVPSDAAIPPAFCCLLADAQLLLSKCRKQLMCD